MGQYSVKRCYSHQENNVFGHLLKHLKWTKVMLTEQTAANVSNDFPF